MERVHESYVNKPLYFHMPTKLKHFTQLAKNTQFFSFFLLPSPLWAHGETWGKGRVIREHCKWKLLPKLGRCSSQTLGGVSNAAIKPEDRAKSFNISLDTGFKESTVDPSWILFFWLKGYSMSEMLDNILTKVSQSLWIFHFVLGKKQGFTKLQWVSSVTSFPKCLFIPAHLIPPGITDLTVNSF